MEARISAGDGASLLVALLDLARSGGLDLHDIEDHEVVELRDVLHRVLVDRGAELPKLPTS